MVATKVTCVVSARASLVPRVDVDAMQTGERLQNNWSHGQTSPLEARCDYRRIFETWLAGDGVAWFENLFYLFVM